MYSDIKRKRFIAFMPVLSLSSASLWNNIGSILLILGAFAVFFGTVLTIWTGGLKEKYADERIKANEQQTATANEEAAKANRDTEKFRKENLQLSLQLESEKVARLKIESGLASRQLKTDSRTALVNALSSIQPSPRIQLTRLVGDSETRHFGDQFIQALKEAHVLFQDNTIGMSPGFPDGLSLIVFNKEAGEKLLQALRSSGFAPKVSYQAPNESVDVHVLIGMKPPAF